jgi:hypothetical protein
MNNIEILEQAKVYVEERLAADRKARIYYLNRLFNDFSSTHFLLIEHVDNEVRKEVMESDLEIDFGVWRIKTLDKNDKSVVFEMVSVKQDSESVLDIDEENTGSLVGAKFKIGSERIKWLNSSIPDIEMILEFGDSDGVVVERRDYDYALSDDRFYIEKWGKSLFEINIVINKLTRELHFNK